MPGELKDAFKRFSAFIYFILLILTALFIATHPNEIRFDAHVALTEFSWRNFPKFHDGITLNLLIGIYNTIVQPAREAADAHIRILSMTLFTGFSYLLACRILTREWLRTVFVVILFTSRLPFLWHAPELIAGAFLALSLLLMVSNARGWWVGLCLGFFALIKPDLILTAAALLVLFVWKRSETRGRWQAAGSFAGIIVALLLAGMVLNRTDPYWSGSGWRSHWAIMQHYSDLFYKHQLMEDVPTPFDRADQWQDRLFPEGKTLGSFLWNYPSHYIDFVALSVARGCKRAVILFHLFFLIFFIRFWFWVRHSLSFYFFEQAVWVSLIGLLPMVLLAFPHIRYLARFFPPLILVALLFLQKLIEYPSHPGRSWGLITSGAITLAAMLTQVVLLIQSLAEYRSENLFWFPD